MNELSHLLQPNAGAQSSVHNWTAWSIACAIAERRENTTRSKVGLGLQNSAEDLERLKRSDCLEQGEKGVRRRPGARVPY